MKIDVKVSDVTLEAGDSALTVTLPGGSRRQVRIFPNGTIELTPGTMARKSSTYRVDKSWTDGENVIAERLGMDILNSVKYGAGLSSAQLLETADLVRNRLSTELQWNFLLSSADKFGSRVVAAKRDFRTGKHLNVEDVLIGALDLSKIFDLWSSFTWEIPATTKAMLTDRMKDHYYRHGFLPGFFGMDWHACEGVFTDESGTIQRILPEGRALMGTLTDARPGRLFSVSFS